MRKKTFPPLLQQAFKKNDVALTQTVSLTGSRVKYFYPAPREIISEGFWTKKSFTILSPIIHMMPPRAPKSMWAAVIFGTPASIPTQTDYGNGYRTTKYSRE